MIKRISVYLLSKSISSMDEDISTLEDARLALADKLKLGSKTDEEIDIAYQLQTIRAAIANNEEIWERCSSYRIKLKELGKLVFMINWGYFKIYVKGRYMSIKSESIYE